MSDFIFAAQQGRKIPKEDKNFAVNNRAKAMIAEKGKFGFFAYYCWAAGLLTLIITLIQN